MYPTGSDFHQKSRLSRPMCTTPQGVLKSLERVQKSEPGQLPARISPSSDGVEIKTGYVGLPTRRVLSRRLVFRVNRKRKIHFCCRANKYPVSGKSGKELSGRPLNQVDPLNSEISPKRKSFFRENDFRRR